MSISILSRSDDLAQRAALVTGATGNLGSTVVRRLLERGAHVVAPIRDISKADALRSQLGDLGGERLVLERADANDPAAMEALVERALRAWGRLDIALNLAGGFATGAATDVDLMRQLWRRNVETAVVATAAALRPMRARGYGRVISVSATAALKGGPNAAAYAMSKAALVRWTESLAAEVKAEGVTVNVVLPAAIDRPADRAKMPKADPSRWASADEVAAVLLFLASAEASGVTGAAIPITARG